MANSQEIFEQISELYSQFEAEHNVQPKQLNQEQEKLLGKSKN